MGAGMGGSVCVWGGSVGCALLRQVAPRAQTRRLVVVVGGGWWNVASTSACSTNGEPARQAYRERGTRRVRVCVKRPPR